MSLVAGSIGQKVILTDGAQIDHISENTNGHGVRIKGISDPATYPVIAGDIGEMFGTERTSTTVGSSYSTRSTTALTGTPAAICSITLNKGIYLVSGRVSGYHTQGASYDMAIGVAINGVAVTVLTADSIPNSTSVTKYISATPIVIKVDSQVVSMWGSVSSCTTWANGSHELYVVRIA